MRSCRTWARPELYLLHRLFACTPTAQLARAMGRTYSSVSQQANLSGLKKSAAYYASHYHVPPRALANQFKPGHITWNKGAKGWDSGGRSHQTRFKPGQTPPHLLPLYTLRVTKDGLIERKVATRGRVCERWIGVHRLVWIEHHGPVPAGHVVAFREGQHTTDPEAITVDKLELLTHAQLMVRNSYHTRYPPEICQLIQLRGALNRQIRKRERNEKPNPGSA